MPEGIMLLALYQGLAFAILWVAVTIQKARPIPHAWPDVKGRSLNDATK